MAKKKKKTKKSKKSSKKQKEKKSKKKQEKTQKKIEPKLLPELNIGLVGHVDHGKSTITEALSGKWPDTHSEEKKRGITIRLGYADCTIYKCPNCDEPACYGTTEKCKKCFAECEPVKTVSLVDAPGHETLMTTVLSGASMMSGALLVISAVEDCPQPQTQEHLKALNIVGIEDIVVVQNKIDLVSEEEARENYEQIKQFLKKNSVQAPIIPISAQQKINTDALIKAILENIPTPDRDPKKPPRMLVARSFDVNKPGTEISKLKGGVVGGDLTQGKLEVGDEVEIRPGVSKEGKFQPLKTEIRGLQKSGKDLKKVTPGGLLGVQTSLDPYLTKSDNLAGSILGKPGELPETVDEVTFKPHLMERLVGTEEEEEIQPIKTGDVLMMTACVSRTIGEVTSATSKRVEAELKRPLCIEKDHKIAISRQTRRRWRLIGWGEMME